jgi:hypothetical protein
LVVLFVLKGIWTQFGRITVDVEDVVSIVSQHGGQFPLVVDLGADLSCSDAVVDFVSLVEGHDIMRVYSSLKRLAANRANVVDAGHEVFTCNWRA